MTSTAPWNTNTVPLPDYAPPVILGAWEEWGECEEGWRYRERCTADWESCEFEEEECVVGARAGEWSSWGKCDQDTGQATRERESEELGWQEEIKECQTGQVPKLPDLS